MIAAVSSECPPPVSGRATPRVVLLLPVMRGFSKLMRMILWSRAKRLQVAEDLRLAEGFADAVVVER